MKHLVRKVFSLFGVGIHRLEANQNGARKTPPKFVVSSTLGHNSREGMEEFYSDREMVESYLDFEFYNRLINLALDNQIGLAGKCVADVGCGAGHLLRSIEERFRTLSLTGLDVSENALRIGREVIPKAEFRCFDIYEGADVHADIVFCVEVLEHLLYPDRALKSVVRMIAPGGAAILTVPNGRTDTFEGHINFWSPESWQVFIDEACSGFDIKTGLLDEAEVNFAIIKRSQETGST
jgi:2-polyprenyl-3-methyl-5-hydroxy-6-metoxy-1,4-benzoquinol methylase